MLRPPLPQPPLGPPAKKGFFHRPLPLILSGVGLLLVIAGIVALVLILTSSSGSSSTSASVTASSSATASGSATPRRSASSAPMSNGPLMSRDDIVSHLVAPTGFAIATDDASVTAAQNLEDEANSSLTVDFTGVVPYKNAAGDLYLVQVSHLVLPLTDAEQTSAVSSVFEGTGATDPKDINARERVGTLDGTGLTGSVDVLVRPDVIILGVLQNGNQDDVSLMTEGEAAALPGP